MGERPSTTRSRDLGKELVRVRKAKGLNGNDIATKLGWERGKVTRVELGKQAVDELDLVAWLIACDVRKPEMHRLVGLNREANQDIWFQQNDDAPPEQLRNLPSEEAQAETIVNYAIAPIPGLLQAEPYIRAITSHLPLDQADRIVASRIERQKLLRDTRVSGFEFFIEDQALRRPIGGPAVMHDQLMHLMFLSRWKRITIRVVPISAGWHSGVVGGFILIRRRDKRSVAYVDTRVTSVYYENLKHIKRYEDTIEELTRLALSVEESRAFITELADEYGRPREDPHGLAEEQL